MNMPTAVIQQRTGIAIAGYFTANGVGVQQFQLFIAVLNRCCWVKTAWKSVNLSVP